MTERNEEEEEHDYVAILEDAYKPDATGFCLPYAQEYEIAKRLGVVARHHKALGCRHRADQLHRAWCDLHPGAAGSRIQDAGTDKFMTLYEEALRLAEEVIEEVVTVHIPELKMCADPIDGVSARSDPWRLIEYAERDRSAQIEREEADVRQLYPHAKAWSGRPKKERNESFRRLAVGNQFLTYEALDPQRYRDWDVVDIDDLFGQRLFFGDTVTLEVSIVVRDDLKTGKEMMLADFPIQIDNKVYTQALPEGARVKTILFDCRVVKDGDLTIYLSSTFRAKSRKSAIIKLGRGREVLDGRGVCHVLVAMEDASGIRVPTIEDVEMYQEIVRRRFFQKQLVETPDMSPPNLDSDSEFIKDVRKIMGRYIRRDYVESDLWVAVMLEVLMYSIVNHFRAVYGKGAHSVYRQKNVARGVLRQWFDVQVGPTGEVSPKR